MVGMEPVLQEVDVEYRTELTSVRSEVDYYQVLFASNHKLWILRWTNSMYPDRKTDIYTS